MKRTIFLNALALLISAGIAAQSTNPTQNQTQVQNQTQLQKMDRTRLQDPAHTMSQSGARSQMRSQSNFQARRTPGINAAARNNMMNRNMKMSSSSFAHRR